jgi:hypothetical protein
MNWRSLADLLPFGQRRAARARLELAEAYQAALAGQAGEIVIADLANFTGFFEVTEAHAPPEIRAFNDGKRAAFGRLFYFLNMSAEDKAKLLAAARLERNVDAAEGYLDP